MKEEIDKAMDQLMTGKTTAYQDGIMDMRNTVFKILNSKDKVGDDGDQEFYEAFTEITEKGCGIKTEAVEEREVMKVSIYSKATNRNIVTMEGIHFKEALMAAYLNWLPIVD